MKKTSNTPTPKAKLYSCPDYKKYRKSGDTAKCAYKKSILVGHTTKTVLTCDGVHVASKDHDGTRKDGKDRNGNPIYTETACRHGGR